MLHQVYFWMNRPGNPDDRARLIAGLRRLGEISVVRSLEIGLPASTEERAVVDSSWDVCETMRFANTDEQAIYQNHPLHLDFVADCGPLWRKVLVYDSIPA